MSLAYRGTSRFSVRLGEGSASCVCLGSGGCVSRVLIVLVLVGSRATFINVVFASAIQVQDRNVGLKEIMISAFVYFYFGQFPVYFLYLI